MGVAWLDAGAMTEGKGMLRIGAKHLLAAVILALVIGWVYREALSAPMAFDDSATRDYVRMMKSWHEIIGRDVFGFFRPVKNLQFFVLERNEFPLWVWHAANLGMFWVAAVSLYLMAARLARSSATGMGAALAWVISATCGTVAVWVSCFNILFAATAMFWCVILYDWGREGSGVLRHLPWVACLLAGLFSYETAVAAAPLLLLVDHFRGRRVFSPASMKCYAAAALLVVAWLVARHSAGALDGRSGLNPSYLPEIKKWQIAASAPYFLWTHFEMWALPDGRLQLLGSYIWDQSVPKEIIPFCWLLLTGVAAGLALLWRRFPFACFGIAWFLIVSFPSGNFIPLGNTPYADYYVPLPSAGLCIALAAGCELLIRKMRQPLRESRSVAIVCGTLFAALVAWRVSQIPVLLDWLGAWKVPLNVMARTAVAKPWQFLAHASVAYNMAHAEEKLSDDAIRVMEWNAEEALKVIPDYGVALMALGQARAWRGDTAGAENDYRKGMAGSRLGVDDRLSGHLALARLLKNDPARSDETWAEYRVLLQAYGSSDHVSYIIEAAEFLDGRNEKAGAVAVLKRGLASHPGDRKLEAALEKFTQPK